MKILAYRLDEALLFVESRRIMTKLPSGMIFTSGSQEYDIRLTLTRLGAVYLGEIYGELDPVNFDALSDLVRELEGHNVEPGF